MNSIQIYISELDISRFLFQVASSSENFDTQNLGVFRTYLDYLKEKKMRRHVQNLNSLKERLYQERTSYSAIKEAMERAIATEMFLSLRGFISQNLDSQLYRSILEKVHIKDHAEVALKYIVWLYKTAETINWNALHWNSKYVMSIHKYAPLDHIGELSVVIKNTNRSWELGVTFTVVTDIDLQERIIIVRYTNTMKSILERLLKTHRFVSEQTKLELPRIQHRDLRSYLYSGILNIYDDSSLLTKVEVTKYSPPDNAEPKFYILKTPNEKSF